nr:integrase, catalytic region, zinc finger, CCHC-type, peptidase aspartic, catalytic [Tanacetum cinerariifolium]
MITSSRFFCQNLQFCWSQTSLTNSPDKILKPIFSDSEYGCAWYGSVVRGGMKLLWLTESHSTTVAFCLGLRFVLDCVLSSTAFCSFEDQLLRFAKDKLYQTQNCVAFCLVLRFASEDCVLKNLAFCPKDLAFCSRRILHSQMYNNIMAAGSRDRPPMLAPGQYPQWRLRFLRYVDRRPNGEALRKCILSGPYKPTTVLVQAVEATDDSLSVPEHMTVETPTNMSQENKAHFLAKKEAIHLILTGIGDEIYSTVDACQTVQEMWEAVERFVTIIKQQNKLDEVSYHKLFHILKEYQNEVNELRAKKLARNVNPLALVAIAQASQDPYYQTRRSHISSAPSPKPSIPSRSHMTTRHKGKEIDKPITPPSETVSEKDSDPEQAQRDKDMQKNLILLRQFLVMEIWYKEMSRSTRKSTCFVRDLQGNDLLVGNCRSDLYTISLQESTSSTPLYLMAKATPNQAWLWHRRLSHLNFDYINLLSKKDIVICLPKLKYVKD